MAKILIARGQATIYVQKDGYTITQSLGEYVFPADDTGKILSSVTLTSTVRVMCGDEELTAFTIGAVGKPAGFSSVTVNNGTKTLTYVITAGTTTLADHGTIDIPVTISGIVYHLSFVWSKAKAGIPGKDGVDATCSTGSRSGIRVRRSSTATRSSPPNSLRARKTATAPSPG